MTEQSPTGADRNMLRRLRILIIGGGAIGQVYGHHLQEGGAEVAYFLKPRYAAESAEGFDLHRYGLRGLRPKRHLGGFEVYTDYRRLRTLTFDQIWLCVSSTALQGDYVSQIADACPDAIWVSFQPGLEDRQYLVERISADRLITGMVNFIAYQAPLPGEDLWPEGIAYFVPPWSMTLVQGPEPFAAAIANLLQSGGMPAGVRSDAIETSRFGSSVLIPFVIALECSGWSFEQLRSSPALIDLMRNAVSDIQIALEKATGCFPGFFGFAKRRLFWKLALQAVPRLAPFPIEKYFEHHFTKVRDQSDQMLEDFVQHCRDNAVIPQSCVALGEQWRVRRPDIAVDEAFRDPKTGRSLHEITPMPGTVPAGPGDVAVSVSGAFSQSELLGQQALPPLLDAPVVDYDTEPTPVIPVPKLPAGNVEELEEEQETTPLPMPPEPESDEAEAELPSVVVNLEEESDEVLLEVEIEGPGFTLFDLEEESESEPASAHPLFRAPDEAAAPSSAPILRSITDLGEAGEPGLPNLPEASAPSIIVDDSLLTSVPSPVGPQAVSKKVGTKSEVTKPITKAAVIAAIGRDKKRPKQTRPAAPRPVAPKLAPPASAVPVPEAAAKSEVAPAPKTAVDPPPEEPAASAADEGDDVRFGTDLPDGDRKGVSRQDFVQTELATDAQSKSLRDLKKKLRARLGGSSSPAAQKEGDNSK